MAELTIDGPLVPKGYEQLTGLSGVKTLTVPAGAWIADVQSDPTANKDVRFRMDGTPPTATVGEAIQALATKRFVGRAILEALVFIEEGASAKINVTYYGG